MPVMHTSWNMKIYSNMWEDSVVLKNFITNLAKEMTQLKQNDIPLGNIFAMIEGILIFVEGRDTDKYETI